MTNKENSIKLKELGFEMDAPVYHHAIRLYRHGEETYTGSNQPEPLYDYAPAYTSDQLFKWLRENPAKVELTTGWVKVTLSKDPSLHRWAFNGITISFKTNLTDMLAKAVIWILERCKQ